METPTTPSLTPEKPPWWHVFQISDTVLKPLGTLAGVLGAISLAYLSLYHASSKTTFELARADDKYIHLMVWNSGRKPSRLVGYRLTFDPPLQIKDLPLRLGHGASAVIPPGGQVELGLTVPELEPRKPNGEVYTKPEIVELLDSEETRKVPVTLTLEVEESNDPGGGFLFSSDKPRLFHLRTDTFPLESIAEFIKGRMSDE